MPVLAVVVTTVAAAVATTVAAVAAADTSGATHWNAAAALSRPLQILKGASPNSQLDEKTRKTLKTPFGILPGKEGFGSNIGGGAAALLVLFIRP